MAELFYEVDADLDVIRGRKVAVIGYGSQGHAHALSLQDSGVDVRVGLAEGSKSRAKAEADGLRVVDPATAASEADVIMILVPDPIQKKLYEESIEPHLKEGNALLLGRLVDVRHRRDADAPRRHIDDPPQRQLVVRIQQQPQVAERILDLLAVEEALRPHQPVGKPPRPKRCSL